mmetsp:Transcript_16103/g.34033  ORF Transcript_16103/g.34033 Transcript_16103/m.34033 type:complete len:574 (+) Transcript_16103:173-1894(+)
MSGLLHLVEAATALTQLVEGTNNLPRQQPFASSTSMLSPPPIHPAMTSIDAYAPSMSYSSRRASSHTISDDDDVMASKACSKMEALRENHLQALRLAASNAGMMVSASPSQTAPTVHANVPQGNAYSSVNRQPRCEPNGYQVTQRIPTETLRCGAVPANAAPAPAASVASADTSKEMFPMRLHALLSDPTVRDVISWLPHGKSFVVLRPDVFATRVLPRYFAPEGSNSVNAKTTTVVGKDGTLVVKNKSPGVHKYPSFTRKLNRWGFRQISRGPDAGAFCHELFQREDPGLCRGMVCQKSRKMKKMPMSAAGGMMMDDMMSVSSASTMGTKLSIASGEKRPYSSTVTVSTAGATSNKSLPFKKRKSGQMSNFMMNGIPSMISHRSQKMAASTSSVTESDLTSDTSSSSSSSVCSNNAVAKAPVAAANNAVAPVAAAPTTAASAPAEATAMEVLARHFHEQHRAFALASLLENSRMAMNAAGMNNQVNSQVCAQPMATNASVGVEKSRKYSPRVLGAATTHSSGVFAATVSIPEEKKMPAIADHAPAQSAADAAKNALYKAYLQALSSHSSASS